MSLKLQLKVGQRGRRGRLTYIQLWDPGGCGGGSYGQELNSTHPPQRKGKWWGKRGEQRRKASASGETESFITGCRGGWPCLEVRMMEGRNGQQCYRWDSWIHQTPTSPSATSKCAWILSALNEIKSIDCIRKRWGILEQKKREKGEGTDPINSQVVLLQNPD